MAAVVVNSETNNKNKNSKRNDQNRDALTKFFNINSKYANEAHLTVWRWRRRRERTGRKNRCVGCRYNISANGSSQQLARAKKGKIANNFFAAGQVKVNVRQFHHIIRTSFIFADRCAPDAHTRIPKRFSSHEFLSSFFLSIELTGRWQPIRYRMHSIGRPEKTLKNDRELSTEQIHEDIFIRVAGSNMKINCDVSILWMSLICLRLVHSIGSGHVVSTSCWTRFDVSHLMIRSNFNSFEFSKGMLSAFIWFQQLTFSLLVNWARHTCMCGMEVEENRECAMNAPSRMCVCVGCQAITPFNQLYSFSSAENSRILQIYQTLTFPIHTNDEQRGWLRGDGVACILFFLCIYARWLISRNLIIRQWQWRMIFHKFWLKIHSFCSVCFCEVVLCLRVCNVPERQRMCHTASGSRRR